MELIIALTKSIIALMKVMKTLKKYYCTDESSFFGTGLKVTNGVQHMQQFSQAPTHLQYFPPHHQASHKKPLLAFPPGSHGGSTSFKQLPWSMHLRSWPPRSRPLTGTSVLPLPTPFGSPGPVRTSADKVLLQSHSNSRRGFPDAQPSVTPGSLPPPFEVFSELMPLPVLNFEPDTSSSSISVSPIATCKTTHSDQFHQLPASGEYQPGTECLFTRCVNFSHYLIRKREAGHLHGAKCQF